MKKIRLAILASGSGSNAENIIRYFKAHENIEVSAVLTNNPKAYVLERVKPFWTDTLIFTREEFYHTDTVLHYLKDRQIDYIILAGFLWLVPENLLNAYSNKIINIHPALLPKYGGKGMYGMRVHEAVVANKEKETGITIHLVNREYDKGEIIFQEKVLVEPKDTPDTVAEKIHSLEQKFFPEVIENIVMKNEN